MHLLVLDVRNQKEVDNALHTLPDDWKNIDVLVNNAGLAAGKDAFEDASMDDWEAMIDTNVKGLLYVTKAVIPYMITRKKGHIINIGSIAGKQVYDKGNVYAPANTRCPPCQNPCASNSCPTISRSLKFNPVPPNGIFPRSFQTK